MLLSWKFEITTTASNILNANEDILLALSSHMEGHHSTFIEFH